MGGVSYHVDIVPFGHKLCGQIRENGTVKYTLRLGIATVSIAGRSNFNTNYESQKIKKTKHYLSQSSVISQMPTSSSSSSSSSSAQSAGGVVLTLNGDGVARRAGEVQYTETMMRKNVHDNTRTQYSNKQKKIAAWALTQPGLKDHVEGGALKKDGLEKMASHAKWFIAFLNSLSYPDGEIPILNDDADILLSKGISTMQGYKSALHKAFEENKITKSEDYIKEIRMYFNALARNHAQKVQEDGLSVGKDAMNAPYYKAVASACLQCKNAASSSFTLCYLLLTWNLIARSDNTAGISFKHPSWDSDHLNVEWYITKSDQQAKKVSEKAVYANPLSPLTCPIIALCLYLMDMAAPTENKHKKMLFPSKAV